MNTKTYIKPSLTDFGDIPSITQGLAGSEDDSAQKHVNCDVLKDGNKNNTPNDSGGGSENDRKINCAGPIS